MTSYIECINTLDMYIAHTEYDVFYIPRPNRVEIVLTNELAPLELTRTAFLLPVCSDGAFILANNQRRGWEIPGGHIEPGESMEEAAVREVFEEVGASITKARPIGYLRMISEGDAPEHWRYPHPVSYQQFFTGDVREMIPFTTNDECREPVRVTDLSDKRITRATIRVFGQHVIESSRV